MDWRKSIKLPWSGPGRVFVISITSFNLMEFITHILLHCILSVLFGINVSLAMALVIEYKDGESGNREGLNFFPDLLSRVIGVFIWDILTRL